MKSIVLIAVLILSKALAVEQSAKNKRSWSGVYLRDDSKYNLIVDQWNRDAMEVDVFKPGQAHSDLKDGFIALINGDRAEHLDIREPHGCRIIVKREVKGLEIEDLCSGLNRLNGFYYKQQ